MIISETLRGTDIGLVTMKY